MNDAIWLKLLDQLPAIVTAVGVIVAAWFSYKSNQKGKENAASIEKVEKSVNGKMEQLLTVTKAASRAEGILEGENNPHRITIVPDDVINVKLVEEE